jgi:hypothetical protein
MIVYRVFLGAFLAVLLYTFYIPSDDEHLERERFNLPVNGEAVLTTKPLLAYTRYFIRISSPLDLHPFRTENFRWFRENDVYWRSTLDGVEHLDSRSEKGPNNVILEAQGIGEPLRIQTSEDFTATFDAPTLSTVITRSRWWRHEDGPDLRPALI